MEDSVSCQKCPEDQWTNDINQCVPKSIEFLSYTNDPTVLVISVISVLCFFKSSVILGIFILFQDTPVVQANNKTMSFILLASIMLSFLCVFLFLGRPTHVTCMLRQTSFGIIFSVAISSILAKTIMVYMAFKATKPGSSWRRLIGVKITNCVVFFCSFIQVLLSIIWLSTSPPFPEMNTHFYQDKIIFQCNEGSMLAFSILLGYMGLLAAISFIVAFLARNLPDHFNEAKNITFSMLVVCSVWVAFIPSYMSVTGKNTVLVEIFAVISSSVGVLGCIFFPKCYIILVRPELNSKCSLSSQIKTNTKATSHKQMDYRARDQTWLSQLQEVFKEDTVGIFNTNGGGAKEQISKLRTLLHRRTRLWWNKASLGQYLTRSLIPRGLRVQIFPAFSVEDLTFKKEWEETANKCSQGFMELLVRLDERKLGELEKEIDVIQISLKETLTVDALDKLNGDLEKDLTKCEQ
ncbi:vomeronasal type-2 receptor 26-like [Dendrobates tinctorius]|uniref:vomeronasal type-2 receptor 26-like n=1 Tax=Dendrobates tinctorius TaxID=92724 RepID=UPI003CC9588F